MKEAAAAAGVGVWLILKSLWLGAYWTMMWRRRGKGRLAAMDDPEKEREAQALRERVKQLEGEVAFFRKQARRNAPRQGSKAD